MKLLILALALASVGQAERFPIVNYGAVCDGGSTDDTPAVTAALNAAYAARGGDIVLPAGKFCSSEWTQLMRPGFNDLPIHLTSDGGPYGATLSCKQCAILVVSGEPGHIGKNKTVSNLILDISNSTNPYVTAISLNNMERPTLRGVAIINTRSRTSTTGLSFYNSPGANNLCIKTGGSEMCHGSDGNFYGLWMDGEFDYSIRMQGSVPTVTTNQRDHIFHGGRISARRTCASGTCYGVFVENAKNVKFVGTRITGAHLGFFMRGDNHQLVATSTLDNSVKGVWFDTFGSPRASFNNITSGNHPDGVLLCEDCSMVNTVNETLLTITKQSSTRTFEVATCTTPAAFQSSCTSTITLPQPFPFGQGGFRTQCSWTGTFGIPILGTLNALSNSQLQIQVNNGGNGPSGGAVYCRLVLWQTQ